MDRRQRARIAYNLLLLCLRGNSTSTDLLCVLKRFTHIQAQTEMILGTDEGNIQKTTSTRITLFASASF